MDDLTKHLAEVQADIELARRSGDYQRLADAELTPEEERLTRMMKWV